MTDDIAAWLTAIWDEQEKAEACKYRRREGIPEFAKFGPIWDEDGVVTVTFIRQHGGREERMLHADYLAEFCEPNPDLFALARVAADRQILALAEEADSLDMGNEMDRGLSTDPGHGEGPYLGEKIRRTLAAAYADRPGYNPDWRP